MWKCSRGRGRQNKWQEPQFNSFHLAEVIFHFPIAEQNTCQSHLFKNVTPEMQCSNPRQTNQSKFSETCPSEISQEVFIVAEILLFASVLFPCSVSAVTSISQEESNQGWFKSRTLERLNKYQIKRTIFLPSTQIFHSYQTIDTGWFLLVRLKNEYVPDP